MNDPEHPSSRPRSRAALIGALIGAALSLGLGLVLLQLATFTTAPPRPTGWFRPTWDDLTAYEVLRASGTVFAWIVFPSFLVCAAFLAAVRALRSR